MRAAGLAALLLALVLLGGCWGVNEINELAFIMGIAVDAGDTHGDYRVTVQAARPYLLVSSGGADGRPQEGGMPYINFTGAGQGIALPLDALSRRMNRRLYTGHNQVLILGREAAEGGVAPILDHFIRAADGRLTVSLFVAEYAAAVLEAETKLGHIPATHLMGLVTARRGGADIHPATLMTFLAAMLSPTTAPTAPLIALEADGASTHMELRGTAVFKGDTLAGTLSADQTRALSLATGTARRDTLALQIGDGSVTLDILGTAARTRPVLENGALGIEVHISTECAVADTHRVRDLLSPALRQEIATAAEARLTALLEDTLSLSRTLGADIFGFGEALHRGFPRESAALLADWDAAYAALPVRFSVDIEVSSTGALLEPLPPQQTGVETRP